MGKVSKKLLKQVMSELGKRGGKKSLETMTPDERSARAKKASLAAAKKRTAGRLAREAAKRRTK